MLITNYIPPNHPLHGVRDTSCRLAARFVQLTHLQSLVTIARLKFVSLEVMHGLNMIVLVMPQDLVAALVLDHHHPVPVALTTTVGAKTSMTPSETANVQASRQDGVVAFNHWQITHSVIWFYLQPILRKPNCPPQQYRLRVFQ